MAAARDGDRAAVEALAARYLPLVHSVVGRGADRDLDVDDIVQDAMVRVVTGVSTVRQAGRFRSWVVTIALRQLADARAEARRARLTRGEDQPDGLPDTADPAADFVGLAVLRQVLDVEQRGIAEAARWLDPAHRTVLSLWWLEAGGHLTRAEVADALDLPAAHAGVRVQRMREQLDVAPLGGPRPGRVARLLPGAARGGVRLGRRAGPVVAQADRPARPRLSTVHGSVPPAPGGGGPPRRPAAPGAPTEGDHRWMGAQGLRTGRRRRGPGARARDRRDGVAAAG